MNFTLRKFRESDLESLVKYANNYNIAKNLTNAFPHPYTEQDGKNFLSIALTHPSIFTIDVAGEAVGSIGLFLQTDIHEKSAELGYWLAEPFWGKGIITQAIQEMVEYGFKTFDIVRIYARPFSTNLASQRVLEKAGFTCEARLTKSLYKNGEIIDEIIYAKFKDDMDIKDTIIALEKQALELWNNGNPDGFIDLSADDVVYIDPAFENKLEGKNALEDYYNTIRGKVKIDVFKMINPVVQLSSDVAVLTYNYEAHRDGMVFKMNCTEIYRLEKTNQWKIIHTHWSFFQPNK